MRLAPGDDPTEDDDVPRVIRVQRSRADRWYRRIMHGAGISTLVIMAAIGSFLFIAAASALHDSGTGFFTNSDWEPDAPEPHFGIAAAFVGTVKIGVVAMVIAVPIAIGCALFINEYAPKSLRKTLIALVDLLAAIPSLIYGLWGIEVLQPTLIPVAQFLDDRLGFIPFFHSETGRYDSSYFIAGCVVSLMVLPIATSVIRQVFSQAPASEKEGALALGSTRWGMIRSVVLPFGKGGIIGGSMLGLGRALAETIAVAIIISPRFDIGASVTQNGAISIASLIALRFFGAGDRGVSALMAAGLVLFALTLVVNVLATVVVNRSRSGAGVDA
jgi:phosphate transport system permease protein